MANSKGRCAGCRDYFLREQLTMIGLQGVCSEDCKRTLLDKHKLKVQKRTNTKTRTRKRGMSTDLRRRVCRRDKKVCRICGHMRYRMEVHHVLYRSQGGPDAACNLILLCDDCHRLVHSSKRYWQPILLACLWIHYVEGKFMTVPQVEKRLIKDGLISGSEVVLLDVVAPRTRTPGRSRATRQLQPRNPRVIAKGAEL